MTQGKVFGGKLPDLRDVPPVEGKSNIVDHPPHYADRAFETIDVIEDAIKDAPDPVSGNSQGHVLRYIVRMWRKDDPLTNAKKARWYLDRLIARLEG